MRKISLIAAAIVPYTVVALRPGDPGWDVRLRSHDETMFAPLMGPKSFASELSTLRAGMVR